MRNLYAKLKISHHASFEEIRIAIAKCQNASVKIDATVVLLNEERRRAYDRLNMTLSDIGNLRAAMGLSHAENWRGEEATEYATSIKTNQSKYADFIKKIKQTNGQFGDQAFISSPNGNIIDRVRPIAIFAAIIGLIWLLSIIFDEPAPRSTKPSSNTHRHSPVKPVFTEPALNLPASGNTRRHILADAIAPLEIKTSTGSNYFVKLEDAKSGRDIMDIFIRGGNTVEVDVPLGTYIVKYAIGNNWYGYKHYFGPETIYNKADSLFNFTINGDQISGYTITLYRVSHGNLRTRQINPSEF